jgi:capsular exopolysaccharide synthesis family protein
MTILTDLSKRPPFMNRQKISQFGLEATGAQYKIEIRQLIYFLQRRWVLIVGAIALALAVGIAVVLTATPQYTASAQILFTPPRDRTIGSEGSLLQTPLDAAALESQISLIVSSSLLQQVVEAEGLAQDPEFAKGPSQSLEARVRSLFSSADVDVDNPDAAMERTILALRQKLSVTRVASTYSVTISFTSRDPAKAARLTNAVANTYIADRLSTRLGDTQRSLRLINPATTPTSPSHPRLLLILIAATCGGLFIGVGVAFAAEAFVVGFTTPQQVESSLGVPVLAMLPQLTAADCEPIGGKVNAPRFLIAKPFSRFGEAVRSMRNIVRLGTREKPVKIVQVTSTIPDEGKTTIAMCLAASAASSEQNVVVVDCDLRHATLTSQHQLGRSAGLVNLLEGTATLEETLRFDPQYGVHVLPAGRNTDDPPNLLASERMKEVLASLAERFDLVVIDTPPLDPVVDALVLANMADSVVLVIRWNFTPQSVVQQALKMVWDENDKIGAVLNFIDPRRAIDYDRHAYARFDSKLYRTYYHE